MLATSKRRFVALSLFEMANFQFVILVVCLASASAWEGHSGDSHSHSVRQFSAGADAAFSSNNGGADGSASVGKKCLSPSSDEIENGNVQCTMSGCRVQCIRGYKMGGSRTLYLSCNLTTGDLTYQERPWKETLPTCLPACDEGCPMGQECVAPNKCKASICDPPCQNGGTCIIPDVCNCPLGYSGLLCEEHNCALSGLIPVEATIGADAGLTRMDILCNPGHIMKNGTKIQYFFCRHHKWLTLDKRFAIDEMDVNCYAKTGKV